MLLNSTSLSTLFVGFQTAFQQGLAGVAGADHWKQVSMVVNSTTAEERYGWMKDIPGIREWLGPRVIHNLETADYTIRNKDWELSFGVDRNKIEDDTYGIYSPLFTEMGRQTAEHPNRLVFDLLPAGFSTPCYDGQYFFDTDHPVTQADGSVASVSNVQAGGGNPWFLMDLSRAIKPIVFQQRKPFDFVRMDAATDEAVFDRREYRYGTHGRSNVGFGFWQTAFASKATLDPDNYAAARAAMQAFKRDHGAPLGIVPNALVVGPSNEGKGRQVVENQRKANGEDNEWKGTARLIVCPWLP